MGGLHALLRARTYHWTDDGLLLKDFKSMNAKGRHAKRGLLFERDQELESIMDSIAFGNEYIFETRTGTCYINKDDKADSFDSMWQRAKQKALKNGMFQCESPQKPRFVPEEQAKAEAVPLVFQQRDLRAMSATERMETDGLLAASIQLGHTTTALTQKVYVRKPTRVSKK